MEIPLPKAPFIPTETIERDVEHYLKDAGLLPETPGSIDIEQFLERYLRASLDQYAELPPDVLGVTHFSPGQRPKVEINRDLTEAADDTQTPEWVRGRWRMTLAHEGAHILFHRADLEALASQMSLFDPPSGTAGTRLAPCLKRDLGQLSATIDRREYQANLGMAALLMPRPIFVPYARMLATTAKEAGQPLSLLVRSLAAHFEVSQQAVRIRLSNLQLDLGTAQGELDL